MEDIKTPPNRLSIFIVNSFFFYRMYVPVSKTFMVSISLTLKDDPTILKANSPLAVGLYRFSSNSLATSQLWTHFKSSIPENVKLKKGPFLYCPSSKKILREH